MKNCFRMSRRANKNACRIFTSWYIRVAWTHMPLGADGIQSKELFIELAGKMGGVVLPMLFVGPDRVFDDRGELFTEWILIQVAL